MQSNQTAAISDSTRFTINPDAVATRIGDQIVLVQVGTDRIFSLNSTAARFWELISASLELAEVRRKMLEEFDVDASHLLEEMNRLVNELLRERFIASVNSHGTNSKD